jgi:predicted nucleic acid-binding protein
MEPRFLLSERLSLDLGPGEVAVMALALEHPDFIVILDDALARKAAQAAELEVWGTLKVLIEAKNQGFIKKIEPILKELQKAGMWLSKGIIQRILFLSAENR